MDDHDIQQYLISEGLSIWRVRRLIMTIRLLRLADFDPKDGKLITLEIELVRMWRDARS